MLRNTLIALLALGMTFSAVAQEESSGTTTMPIEDGTAGTTPPLDGEDLDQEITNKRLRAESGSKSDFSASASLLYNGGSVEDPFSGTRPNYRLGTDPASVSASATIQGRYRINANQSTTLGVGVRADQPFHGGLESMTAAEENTSADNPFLSWSSYYKAAGLQMSTGVSYTYYTADGATAAGYEQALSASHSVLGTFADGRLTLGVSLSGAYIDIDGSDGQLNEYNQYRSRIGLEPNKQRQDLSAEVYDIEAGLYPFAEYTLNDMFALRTVFGYFNYESNILTNDFERSAAYQSVGLAISPARDIYIYPNIQFVPLDIRSDRTNVAVSATLNLF